MISVLSFFDEHPVHSMTTFSYGAVSGGELFYPVLNPA
jgi:hypothetical protein